MIVAFEPLISVRYTTCSEPPRYSRSGNLPLMTRPSHCCHVATLVLLRCYDISTPGILTSGNWGCRRTFERTHSIERVRVTADGPAEPFRRTLLSSLPSYSLPSRMRYESRARWSFGHGNACVFSDRCGRHRRSILAV